jgi:hypothetical protein
MIDYEAPPICEGDFTSTGVSTISLLPILRELGPTGLVMEWAGSYYRLRWNTVFGALCYSIYRLDDSVAPFTDYVLVAECVSDNYFDLDVLGGGTYKVTTITQDGESELSEPIVAPADEVPVVPSPPPGGCSVESGAAAPSGAAAFSVSEYPELGEFGAGEQMQPTVPPIPYVPPFYFTSVDSHNPIRWDTFNFNPTEVWDEMVVDPLKRVYTIPGDLPPGRYQIRYESGFESGLTQEHCPAGSVHSINAIYFVGDDEHVGLFDDPTKLGFIMNGLTKVSTTIPPGSDVVVPAAGISFCGSVAALPGMYAAFFQQATFDYRWGGFQDTDHSNTGGQLKVVWDAVGMGDFDLPGAPNNPVYRVLQVSGLIQQARTLQIDDWGTIGPMFPADVAANWDGSFNTRDFYTTTTLRWSDPASGPFGGATLEYVQTHPTAANGCGWTLIVRLGASTIWTGHKTVGDRADGTYYRTAESTGPDCLDVVNKSIWEYPA